MLKLILLLSSVAVLVILVLFIFFFRQKCTENDIESSGRTREKQKSESEELKTFEGGQELTINGILEAPGEVIGKSSYGTLYEASLQTKMVVLRFLKPAATVTGQDSGEIIEFLGRIRHFNLVPLLGFYAGQRGEKLLVHPFYSCGNLADFIRAENAESQKWGIIHKISIGIAKGLDHLHTELQKPVVHGNLKSKNILLNKNLDPKVSDFGLHLLLNPPAIQELFRDSADAGYRAPELIKIRDATEETDVYSYGVILLELLTGKAPINANPTAGEEIHLSNYVRNAILAGGDGDGVTEEEILKCFQLAMTCCSSSPALRPSFRQVIAKLEEIGR